MDCLAYELALELEAQEIEALECAEPVTELDFSDLTEESDND